MQCEIKWCNRETESLIDVNENIGDGSWMVSICHRCASILGLKTGDDLPSADVVKRLIEGEH